MLPLLSLLVRSGAILLGAGDSAPVPSPITRCSETRLASFRLWTVDRLAAALRHSAVNSRVLARQAATHGEIEIRQTFRTVVSASPPHLIIYVPIAIWLTGVLITAGPLLYGFMRLRQLRLQAEILVGTPLNDLLEESCCSLGLPRVPELLLMPGPVMPMTFGLRRPRIVLPEECLLWTMSRQRAVLLHELAHIQRRDVASQLFAHLTTALWWFQPLSWISRHSLRQESERACDELVVQCGVRASDYAAELLAIAKDFRVEAPIAATGIAMARRGDLGGRLHLILAPEAVPKPVALRRLAAALTFISALTIAASALTVSPEPIPFTKSESPQRSSSMFTLRRTVLSGLLASAGLSAATIGGSLSRCERHSGTQCKGLDPQRGYRRKVGGDDIHRR